MDDEVRELQDSLHKLGEEALESLGDLSDPALDTPVEDGRTLRQVIYALSDHYREHIEQLLWTKWGQHIPRSEAKRALAELQGLRAQFAAYFSDLSDDHLDVASAAAQTSSPRDVILHVLEEESGGMALIREALREDPPEDSAE